MTVNAGPPRIVIYGVGQYGSHVARYAVEKGWPIVAAFNRAGPKVGQDLGQIIGLNRDLDVRVQDSQSGDYQHLDADIAVVTHRDVLRANMDGYRRLIGAGLNIACHGSQSYMPDCSEPELAREIDALAKAKGVTFTGCGIWDSSRIWTGILAASPCVDITSLHHSSLTNPQGQVQTAPALGQFSIGGSVESFYANGIDHSPVLLAWKTVPELVLKALGYSEITSVTVIEPVTYDVPVATFYNDKGYFDAGACVGIRSSIRTTTAEGVFATCLIEKRMFLPDEVEHMFWEIDGKPRNRIRMERLDSDYTTAANLFNRIPDIIAARPGIVTVAELGPLRTTAGRWPRIKSL